MIRRFCTYTTLKNLRFFEPFFVLYLLYELNLSFLAIGALVAYQRVLMGLFELPLGAVTDRWGRRRGLMASFACNATAFVLFALAGWSSVVLVMLYVAQTLFAVGEALRSGTHKAMMLDWLEQHNRRDEATRVVGLTRFFSKTSEGVGAILGGLVVYLANSFTPLFWAGAIPAALGFILIGTYPHSLEGEWTRQSSASKSSCDCDSDADADADSNADSDRDRQAWFARARRLLARPGILALMIPSVLFESQIKLSMHYLQPYLARALGQADVAVLGGVGAVLIGAYYLVQGLLAGGASFAGDPLRRRCGGQGPALALVYTVACVAMGLSAVCLWYGQLWLGVAALMSLAVLQNARRPIFIAQLNDLMDPYQRATTLSAESQTRNWVYALAAVVTGYLADQAGLYAAFGLMTLILLPGLLGHLTRSRVVVAEGQ